MGEVCKCTIEGCALYDHAFAGLVALQMHMQRAHSDNPKALTKRKELDVYAALQEAGIEFEYQKHIPFKGCGLGSETSCAYLDFLILKPWGAIVLENDEFQHGPPAYDPSCDVRRDFDICASVALGSAQKLVILRYNPDPFKVDGATRVVAKKERLKALVDLVQSWDADPAPDLLFARFFLFYDQTSQSHLPCVAEQWHSDVAREVSRIVQVS